ncbi:MAG: LytTR family DNA-binding domain-containing protein [Ignavibacteriales bacterium]|nr:LytTR family DNA-binding domain-containing protein [Ignavibacteriales bacterium]
MHNILVIEDDDETLYYIEKILKGVEYNPLSASNGKLGLQSAKNGKPDLIICNIILKDMDGFKVLEELQKSEKLAAIPFIFLSSKMGRSFHRLGMEKGADDYITKPFTKSELLNAVSARLLRAETFRKFKPVSDSRNSKSYNTSISESSENLDEQKKEKLFLDDNILINIDDKQRLIKIKSIKLISAVGDYSRIFANDNTKYIVKRPMKEWETLLPEKYFVRIHRSTIINLEYVDKFEKSANRVYKVFISDYSKPIIMSRRFSTKFKERYI